MSPDCIPELRPQLTASGEAVRLPVSNLVAPLFDSLAVAYTADPDTIGRLLARHAASVLALDYLAVSDDATDYELAMRAAESDGSLEALLAEVDGADELDPVLTPHDAIGLGTVLTRLAARARLTPNPKKAR
ncbi:hypothetical protein ACWGRF_01905 [Streptomyces zhihengii]